MKTQTQNENDWDFWYLPGFDWWVGETQLYNSCGAERGALWPSVDLEQVPDWGFSQCWGWNSLLCVGQNQWAPSSFWINRSVLLLGFTEDINVRTLEPSTLFKLFKHPAQFQVVFLSIISGCCEVVVAIPNAIIRIVEKDEKTRGQYFSTRVHRQTLRFYYELL